MTCRSPEPADSESAVHRLADPESAPIPIGPERAPPPVFVISLARSPERRRRIGARLSELGLGHQFFDAIDGSALDLDRLPGYARHRRRLFFGRDLGKGEIGCLLSHRALYQHLVDSNVPTALILEDDAVLSADLPRVIDALMALRATSAVPWHVIRFLGREKIYRNSRLIGPLVGGYDLTRALGMPGGAYGTLLTRAGAEGLLRRMQRYWVPVDTLHGQTLLTGINTFSVRPSPVLPDDEVASTIGDGRFDKTTHLTGWQRVVYPLFRAAFKLADLLHKRLITLGTWPGDLGLRRRLRP